MLTSIKCKNIFDFTVIAAKRRVLRNPITDSIGWCNARRMIMSSTHSPGAQIAHLYGLLAIKNGLFCKVFDCLVVDAINFIHHNVIGLRLHLL